jgi:hypothetical protein
MGRATAVPADRFHPRLSNETMASHSPQPPLADGAAPSHLPLRLHNSSGLFSGIGRTAMSQRFVPFRQRTPGRQRRSHPPSPVPGGSAAGCATRSCAAALVNFKASPTARKYRRCRSSTAQVYYADKAWRREERGIGRIQNQQVNHSRYMNTNITRKLAGIIALLSSGSLGIGSVIAKPLAPDGVDVASVFVTNGGCNGVQQVLRLSTPLSPKPR